MEDKGSTYRTPRWVKVAGLIVVALLLLFGSLHLVDPSLVGHASGGHGNYAPLSSASEHGRQQP